MFKFPYTNFHELNLDWIIEKIKMIKTAVTDAAASAASAAASKTAAASSAAAANTSKNNAAASAEAAAGSAQTAQNLVDQLDTTIAQDVSDWLAEHITPTTPAVDDTLTVSGAAADAAVTGEKITELKTDITNSEKYVDGKENILVNLNWTTGYSIAADGTLSASDNFRYSDLIPVSDGDYTFVGTPLGVNTNVRFHGYDENGNWVKQIAWYASGSDPVTAVYSFKVSGVSQMRISTSIPTRFDAMYLYKGLNLENEIAETNTKINKILNAVTADDIFGENTTIAKVFSTLTDASWGNNELSLEMNASAGSADVYYASLAPKIKSGHTYKVHVIYEYGDPFTYTYTYIRNIFALSNLNNRDDLINGTAKYNGDEDILTFTATSDGWLSFGARVVANSQASWKFKVSVYDVTGLDLSNVTDDDFKTFEEYVVISSDGILSETIENASYSYNLVNNCKGKIWSALGDSLTAAGSGSQYLGYVKNSLELSQYYNNGVGGSSVSGTGVTAMYQDARIEAININTQCLTVLAGTNDAWQEYYKDHPSSNMTGWGDCVRTNHDVTTFCGAYNVMISKILYKFCRVNGYYEDVDYTGITQVTSAVNDFRLILLTPPQAFHVEGDSMSASIQLNGLKAAHSYVKQIAELWGLPCVDTWEMGMNDMNRALFFANDQTDATHFNALGHERLASLLINKALQISRYD